MRFYEFGNRDNPTVFLIHGTASHWKLSFGQVVDGLTDEYHVVCVAMDGHDENDTTEMVSISDETDKLEDYIQKEYNGKIYGIYGSSLGGSIVGKLLEKDNICTKHAITGSTDFDYMSGWSAVICSKIATHIFYKYVKTGEIKGILNLLIKSEKSKKYLKDLHNGIYKKITYKTLYREYYTDLTMPIADNIIPEKTHIHCIFGMEEDGDKLINRYKKHFPKAEIIGLVGLNHEELLFREPEEWIHMIKTLLNHGEYNYYGGTQKINGDLTYNSKSVS
ncbi:alpha/beta fold hydrolase [Clostridium beijerinckii]|uniref:alpha/beta fold hydrolase n=1 Tax=Clostridium beijerinckii TaxID=1520 RepID=UPI0002D9C156|nr:alpha/beta hydrolase [Clostridium beijerinckii]